MKKSPGRKVLRRRIRQNRLAEGRKRARANELAQKLEARMRPARWRIRAKMRAAAKRANAKAQEIANA